MPLYEYECASCQHRFERIQKFSDPLVEACPTCGGVVRKLLSSPAIQFKGSGWYITDYAKKSGGTDASSTSSSKTESGEKKSDSSEPSSASSGASASTPAAPAKPDS
jgi:putative FmdB family regulatory protein